MLRLLLRRASDVQFSRTDRRRNRHWKLHGNGRTAEKKTDGVSARGQMPLSARATTTVGVHETGAPVTNSVSERFREGKMPVTGPHGN